MTGKYWKRKGRQPAYGNGNLPCTAGQPAFSSSTGATSSSPSLPKHSSLFGDSRPSCGPTALPEEHFPALGADLNASSSSSAAVAWTPVRPSAAEERQWEEFEQERESLRIWKESESFRVWTESELMVKPEPTPTTLATFVFNPERKFGRSLRQPQSAFLRLPAELLSKVIISMDRQTLWRLARTCQEAAALVSTYATVWNMSTGDFCSADKGTEASGGPTDVTILWGNGYVYDSLPEVEVQILKSLTLSFASWAPAFKSLEFQKIPRLTTALLGIVLPKLENLQYLGIFECNLISIIDLVEYRGTPLNEYGGTSLIKMVRTGTRLDFFPTVQKSERGKLCWFVDRSSDCFLGLGAMLLQILPLARQQKVRLIEPGSAFRRWLQVVENRIPDHQLRRMALGRQDDELLRIFNGGQLIQDVKKLEFYECHGCEVNLRGVFYAPNQLKNPRDPRCWGCRTTDQAQDKRTLRGDIAAEYKNATEWMEKKMTLDQLVTIAKTETEKKPEPRTDSWGRVIKEPKSGWPPKGRGWKDKGKGGCGRRYGNPTPNYNGESSASQSAPSQVATSTPVATSAAEVFPAPVVAPAHPLQSRQIQTHTLSVALVETRVPPVVPVLPVAPAAPANNAGRGGRGRNGGRNSYDSRNRQYGAGQATEPSNPQAKNTRGRYGGEGNQDGAGKGTSQANGDWRGRNGAAQVAGSFEHQANNTRSGGNGQGNQSGPNQRPSNANGGLNGHNEAWQVAKPANPQANNSKCGQSRHWNQTGARQGPSNASGNQGGRFAQHNSHGVDQSCRNVNGEQNGKPAANGNGTSNARGNQNGAGQHSAAARGGRGNSGGHRGQNSGATWATVAVKWCGPSAPAVVSPTATQNRGQGGQRESHSQGGNHGQSGNGIWSNVAVSPAVAVSPTHFPALPSTPPRPASTLPSPLVVVVSTGGSSLTTAGSCTRARPTAATPRPAQVLGALSAKYW